MSRVRSGAERIVVVMMFACGIPLDERAGEVREPDGAERRRLAVVRRPAAAAGIPRSAASPAAPNGLRAVTFSTKNRSPADDVRRRPDVVGFTNVRKPGWTAPTW